MKAKRPEYILVEKNNHLAVHALFGQNKAAAEKHLKETIPVYCQKGYFMDKTLTPESFEIVFK